MTMKGCPVDMFNTTNLNDVDWEVLDFLGYLRTWNEDGELQFVEASAEI